MKWLKKINTSQLMTNNLKLKILSLLIAVFLWLFVIGSVNPTIEKEYSNVPITYKNLDTVYDENKTLVGDKDIKVNIKVQGATNDFIRVKYTDIKAEVDLKDFNPNHTEIPIKYTLPEGLRIKEVSQRAIPVRVEQVVNKEVKVDIVLEGKPADDLVIKKSALVPETIAVTGPESVIQSVDLARAMVDMASITDETTRNIPLEVVNSQGEIIQGVEMSQTFVNASFDVSKVVKLPVKLKTKGELPDGVVEVSKELSQNEVSVLIDPEKVDKYTEIETKEFDLSQVGNSGSYDLALEIPEDIKLSNQELEIDLKYNVDVPATKKITVPIKSIEYRNLNENFKASVPGDIKEVEVEISGMKSKVDPTSKDGIKLFLDLKDIKEGESKVKIQNENVAGVKVLAIAPGELKINVEKQ